MRKGLCSSLLLKGLLSCEKTLNIAPQQQSPKLVVEAESENGKAPVVTLSHSLDFFSTIDTATLNHSFIHNASVSISNGVNRVPLQEYTLPFSGGDAAYFYSTAPGSLFIGRSGQTYSLTIKVDGQTYEAETQIPILKKKDGFALVETGTIYSRFNKSGTHGQNHRSSGLWKLYPVFHQIQSGCFFSGTEQ